MAKSFIEWVRWKFDLINAPSFEFISPNWTLQGIEKIDSIWNKMYAVSGKGEKVNLQPLNSWKIFRTFPLNG